MRSDNGCMWRPLVTDVPLPHPTYFPAGLAMGVAFLFWGLITTWVVLVVGVVLFAAALAGWIREGKLKYREDILQGIEAAPASIAMLYAGENRGKLIIKL